jgi:hypothetical protein
MADKVEVNEIRFWNPGGKRNLKGLLSCVQQLRRSFGDEMLLLEIEEFLLEQQLRPKKGGKPRIWEFETRAIFLDVEAVKHFKKQKPEAAYRAVAGYHKISKDMVKKRYRKGRADWRQVPNPELIMPVHWKRLSKLLSEIELPLDRRGKARRRTGANTPHI